MLFFHKVPWLMRIVFPQLCWYRSVSEKVIYLTFDDGPVPNETSWVLAELAKYDAKATFFCVGDNIRKHPDIFQEIIRLGHRVGNHTFNHLNAWKTSREVYLENVARCQELIERFSDKKEAMPLFRPPYGRISPSLIRKLCPTYQIVMWNVLSGDYRADLSPQNCLKYTMKYTQKGSIVVFHDSTKSFKNLSFVLPRFLEYFSQQGYRFDKL